MRRLFWAALACLAAVAAIFAARNRNREEPLPADATGTLVFVSDRTGIDALYMRKLPGAQELRLTQLGEPVREPALSPDGERVAVAVGGRIALVTIATGDIRYLSLGVHSKDGSPAWNPDGKRLVIVSRRAEGESADLFVLTLDGGGVESPRQRLTETPADEREPVWSPDGRFVVFVREQKIYRLDLDDGRVRRLTGGLRKTRQPRFLASGRLVCLWSEDKQFGVDALDADGKNRETLTEGAEYYRTLAPAPNGRYFVATFTYDLSFRPAEALVRRSNEELRLLDARGRVIRQLTEAWRNSNHSADWGR